MKPIPAIVESDADRVMSYATAVHSELRELEVQVEKSDKRLADASRIAERNRAAREMKRVELGQALAAVHRALKVKQGDRSGRWAKFLEKEGIAEETARRWIREAGSYEATSPNDENGGSAGGSADEQPDAPAPGPIRQPFGKLLDMQLLLGTWESMLVDIGPVDVLLSDPPFSERTHKSKPRRADDSDPDGSAPNYEPWTSEDVNRFVEHWSPRVRGWMGLLSDDELIPAYKAAYERMGRIAFQAVPCIINGMTVRLRGDGPSSESVYLMVGRPATAEFARWGTTPGRHIGNAVRGSKHGRGKPPWLMDEIVRAYSRGNDLVCDPLAGYGGTLVSALRQGRRAIGAEQDESAVTEAFRRVEAGEGITNSSADEPREEQAS